jgi:hypothetical protein
MQTYLRMAELVSWASLIQRSLVAPFYRLFEVRGDL